MNTKKAIHGFKENCDLQLTLYNLIDYQYYFNVLQTNQILPSGYYDVLCALYCCKDPDIVLLLLLRDMLPSEHPLQDLQPGKNNYNFRPNKSNPVIRG